jgi:hypothetical protein
LCHTEEEQLTEIAQILQEMEARQHPEWMNIAGCSPIYEKYLPQRKFLVVKDYVLVRNWEAADGENTGRRKSPSGDKVKEVQEKL